MPKVHWTKTRKGKQMLKEFAKKRRERIIEGEKNAEVSRQVEVSQAYHQGRREESQLMDNRARDAQIELAKALSAIGHACAIFVGEWRH